MERRSRFSWRLKQARRPDFDDLRNWLFHKGSLTARLQAKGQFRLRLLTQRLEAPTPDEAAELAIGRKRLARTREVVLHLDGVPVVFAHTVLPTDPAGPVTRWLARLGGRSLGSMLFSHPGFKRGPIACKRLDKRHPLHQRAIDALQLGGNADLWARRSAFHFGAQTILVTEVFLPTISQPGRPVTKSPQNDPMQQADVCYTPAP